MVSRQARLLRYNKLVAGVDEAGRGPLAGPVVAAAVVLPEKFDFVLSDSKLLSQSKRAELYSIILSDAVDVGVGIVSPRIIDELNIRKATLFAMRMAVESLTEKPDKILVDGVDIIPGVDIDQVSVVKGDQLVPVISAASIVAKVLRDEIMNELAIVFPSYMFGKHKGYPTTLHRKILENIGPSPFHRLSFRLYG